MKKKIFRCWDKGNNKIGYVYRDKVTGNVNLGEEYFESWFYVFTADYEKHKSEFNKHIDEKVLIRVVPEGLYSRVYYNNSHISESLDRDMQFNWEYRTYTLKNMLDRFKMLSIQTFEADLKPWRRWMISDDVEIEDTYKIAYYDIETDDRHPDGLDNIGKYRILSIAVKMSDTNHSDGKMYWFCLEEDTDEAERKMLLKFANIIRYTDVLISFNGINFDDIYIKARMLRYGISIDWRKKILQDHCWTYKKYAPGQQSYSLESISQTVLGRGKVDHESYKIYDMWRKNRALLKEYNIEDVQLMYDIEEKTKFLSVHRDVCKEGSFPVDDLYISRKIDNLILKQAERDMFYHFKTKEFDEEEINEGIGYTGAFVFDPVIGRHVNIRVFDFKSLYPNVMVTFNISPDTLITREFIEANPHIPYITTPNGQFFRKDFIGILPKVVKMFTDKRNYYKDLMAKEVPGTMLHKLYDRLQYVYKYYGLSFYGCTGEKNSRMFDVRVAESITLTGQYFTKTVAKYVENNGMSVTYGDTDSAFLSGLEEHHVPQLMVKLKQLCDHHAKKFGCDICTIEMDYDKGFKTFLAIAKKRYAGVIDYLDGHKIDDFNMYIAGLEYKRTDTLSIVKKWQYDLLKVILEHSEAPAIQQIMDMLVEYKNIVYGNKLTEEDVLLSKRLTKPVEEYVGRQMHVMVTKQMREDNLAVYVGDKIGYFIRSLDNNRKPVPAPIHRYEGIYHADYYWNNLIYPPLKRVVEVAYPSFDWEYLLEKKTASKMHVTRGRALW